jgi:cytochrome c oxidase assembly protein subunit 11
MRPRAHEERPVNSDLQKKNRKTLMITLSVVAAMILLSFASVPLYRRLCQITGWGGTTQTAVQNPGKVLEREMIVQLNADVDPRLPWRFKPDMRQVKVKVGQNALISYSAENTGKTPIAGTAIHNVTPLKAGQYFNKTQCFCFGEQVLQPGQKARLPVTFFIDPKIMDDEELKNLKTITLSYTFYRQNSPELEKAMKKFYNEPK